jgi:hypothetical protein
MVKLRDALFCTALLVLLSACGTSAVVSDLEEDKVKVQASGGDISVIDAEAGRGCAVHGRQPQRISYNCLDGYCIRKEYLYACVKN